MAPLGSVSEVMDRQAYRKPTTNHMAGTANNPSEWAPAAEPCVAGDRCMRERGEWEGRREG